MSVTVAGAGAFGTALAVALAGTAPGALPVTLWARDGAAVGRMAAARENLRLPGIPLPGALRVTADPAALDAPVVLIAVPAQALRGFLAEHGARLRGALVACCKGLDLSTLEGPAALIAKARPGAEPLVLTGPGFAADIARGLPTALTLACRDDALGGRLQALLSTSALRLYRTRDVTGAELGGALKNVVALACGAAMGAGLGESARAALLARGFAEMRRLATRLGAEEDTAMGLAGLGDLVLTATSPGSRNYRRGLALGGGAPWEAGVTVEGEATARAACALGVRLGVALPVTDAVAALLERRLTVEGAMRALLDRPLIPE